MGRSVPPDEAGLRSLLTATKNIGSLRGNERSRTHHRPLRRPERTGLAHRQAPEHGPTLGRHGHHPRAVASHPAPARAAAPDLPGGQGLRDNSHPLNQARQRQARRHARRSRGRRHNLHRRRRRCPPRDQLADRLGQPDGHHPPWQAHRESQPADQGLRPAGEARRPRLQRLGPDPRRRLRIGAPRRRHRQARAR